MVCYDVKERRDRNYTKPKVSTTDQFGKLSLRVKGELIKSVSEQLMSDAKALTELGSDFGEKTQKIGQKKVKEITKKAA